ncbi:type I-E CRISPR-associated protein Cas7/Cse4/CasC [Catenulispora rubra]|uniref:type I-E CRISPR-associated protein Cas7/Cse4/CasC n=1 Tax=Catenulispora rubra TaxID=280293 RepID=UPI0018926F1F|nr:type I-E CRISPR-associated protein Cas7/Cse4/CasC [Catenulispora rubra]
MTPPMYLDLHILQTIPPANVNRDDAGSPKSAVYGGVRRSRVSSQAWKRATRQAFAVHLPEAERATRTKKIESLLAARLKARFALDAPVAARLAEAMLAPLGIKAGKKEAETSYLLFFGYRQLEAVVDLVAEDIDALIKLEGTDLAAAVGGLPVKACLGTGHPLDVGLFGRMVANLSELNVDAAVQVAHALSTHGVEVEFDYFTAVDDENTAEQAGAGMIGTIEFNSATLYRYATVGLHQLHANLTDPGAAVQALDLFVDAFCRSVPGGHQSTFAHRTLPHLVVAVLRDDQPINLVGAFERPVAADAGIAEASMRRLAAEHHAVTVTWGGTPRLLVASGHASEPATAASLTEAFGALVPFAEMCEAVQRAAAAWYGEVLV